MIFAKSIWYALSHQHQQAFLIRSIAEHSKERSQLDDAIRSKPNENYSKPEAKIVLTGPPTSNKSSKLVNDDDTRKMQQKRRRDEASNGDYPKKKQRHLCGRCRANTAQSTLCSYRPNTNPSMLLLCIYIA
jgi:hypothetical protein